MVYVGAKIIVFFHPFSSVDGVVIAWWLEFWRFFDWRCAYWPPKRPLNMVKKRPPPLSNPVVGECGYKESTVGVDDGENRKSKRQKSSSSSSSSSSSTLTMGTAQPPAPAPSPSFSNTLLMGRHNNNSERPFAIAKWYSLWMSENGVEACVKCVYVCFLWLVGCILGP